MSVLFCHNVYDRPITLDNTVRIEKELFPDCHQIIAVNNGEFVPVDKYDMTWTSYPKAGHKMGCLNGLIKSMQTVNGEYEAIIFSHDDVYIDVNNLDVVKSNIQKIKDGVDCIYRRPATGYGDLYAMMECLYISQKFASILAKKQLFTNERLIPRDTRKRSISPEVWLAQTMKYNRYLPNIALQTIDHQFTLDGDYNEQLSTTLGFHHKNIGKRFWKDSDVDIVQ